MPTSVDGEEVPTSTRRLSAMEKKFSQPLERTPTKNPDAEEVQDTSLVNEDGISLSDGYKITDTTIIQEVINSISICTNCQGTNCPVLSQHNKKRMGLCETLIIHCTACNNNIKTFQTSKQAKVGGSDKMIDLNLRSVMAATSIGGGLAVLRRLYTDLNFPQPVTEHPYNNYLNYLLTTTIQNVHNSMSKAASRLRQQNLENDDGSTLVDVAVSVDGSWQKRHGFNSLLGMVFIISVDTRQVLDYAVKSLFCHECKIKCKCHSGMEGQTC